MGVETQPQLLENPWTVSSPSYLIASSPKPYRYDPRTHEEEHLSRRNYILYEMWQQGYITEEQYTAASAEPIGLSPGNAGGGNACHDSFHRLGSA